MMHLMYEHTVTKLKECIRMTQTIQRNEYLDEEMVKEQVMRHEMTIILDLMMDEIQIEHKLKIHGYALEAI